MKKEDLFIKERKEYIMINYIDYKLKQSTFKTWVAFSLFHGIKSRSALKQRIKRAINYLNKILKPLNLEVWVREIGGLENEIFDKEELVKLS